MFGAGCFWSVQLVFDKLPGVLASYVGYAGGHTDDPTYQEVCTDQTGHAEVVQIEFDPEQISYEALVRVFFENHNPTTLNRQGADVGSQYRSAVFYYDDEQKAVAERFKADLSASNRFKNPIVTEIEPAGKFTMGEEYHQKYLAKRGKDSCSL